MALCPILKAECIREQCEWWHKWEKICVINTLPARITQVENEGRDVFNAIIGD